MAQWSTPEEFFNNSEAFLQSALTHGRQRYYQNLDYSEMMLSEMFACYINSNRKKGAPPTSARGLRHFAAAAEQYSTSRIDPRAANTIMRMLRQKTPCRLPQWIFELTPYEEVKRSSDPSVGYGDCWVDPSRMAVFAPRIEGNILYAPIALIAPSVGLDSSNQSVPLRVIVTGEPKCTIEVIKENEEGIARLGAEFLITERNDV